MNRRAHDKRSSGRVRQPHVVQFGVHHRRELLRILRHEYPGVRAAWQRAPASVPARRGHRAIAWLWRGDLADLQLAAGDVLRRCVLPMLGERLPYCVGFPFSAAEMAPRPLTPETRGGLDLEDLARLLSDGPPPPAASPPCASGDAFSANRLHLTGLDSRQRAAVEHARGPARVLAPAGAGKTKTLISRVAELIWRGVDPGAILLLAFNRKAAEQFEERLAACGIPSTRRIGRRRRPESAVHCATFNAFGSRYLGEIASRRYRLDADPRGQDRLLRRALRESGFPLEDLKPARGSDPIGALRVALARVRAELEPPDDIAVPLQCTGESPCVHVPFAPVHERFSALQAARGGLTFDDQVYLTVADLLAEPSHRAYVQARYQHVLVDEFQDLNKAQLALVDILSRPRRDLFVVGDDDQLIYGWRHAEIDGILGFHDRMPPQPWSATYVLETNYRCSCSVVGASDRLITNNRRREAKRIRPRPGAEPGAVEIVAAETWPERAAAIREFLRREARRPGGSWGTLAVLCRYRAQQLPVALALDAVGIPRSPLLGYRLFSHPAARLLRAYVGLTLDPAAASAADLRLVARAPERFLSGADVEAATTSSRPPWAGVLKAAAEGTPNRPHPLTRLTRAVDAARRNLQAIPPAELTPLQLLWIAIDCYELEDWWAAQGDEVATDTGAGDPFAAVDALLLLAEAETDTIRFLAEWDRLAADEDAHTGMADDTLSRETDADRVIIGTIHAAKGREYRGVVLAEYFCDLAHLDPAQLEEERRVLYVGVTRAQDGALITSPSPPTALHPFLRELSLTPE